MEDLSLLGNAAAIPIVVAITQFLKRNCNFKHKSEVISLLVAVLVCVGWEFYYTPAKQLNLWWSSGFIPALKHTVHLLVVSAATWLSASKSYDFFIGDKKRQAELQGHLTEKETLKKAVEELKNGKSEEPHAVDTELDTKLRTILEER